MFFCLPRACAITGEILEPTTRRASKRKDCVHEDNEKIESFLSYRSEFQSSYDDQVVYSKNLPLHNDMYTTSQSPDSTYNMI